MKKGFIQTIQTGLAATVALLAAASAHASTSWASGGNWADDGDNFQDGVIYPTGITSSTTTTQAAAMADTIAADDASVGINLIRIGINTATVSGNWAVAQAYINELTAKGMYVDLACWDGSDKDGVINDFNAWKSMWLTVDGVYGGNDMIYYEPFNEPHGYTTAALEANVYTPFLGFISKRQDHIILDGTGYANDVTAIGADSSYNGCLLGIHIYPTWWGQYTTESGWESALATHVGSYASRTIMTEMGAPATTGINYDSPSGNVDVCFIRGICAEVFNLGMGMVYWPAHRAGDTFHLFNSPGGGVANQSMIDQLQGGWHVMCKPAVAASGPVWNLRTMLTTGGANFSYHYGGSSDTHFVMGDWDGNGSMTPGVIHTNSVGQWEFLLHNANASGSADYDFVYGTAKPGDVLVVGDWDGNGIFTPGIVRTNSVGQLEWLLRNSNSSGNADYDFVYGLAGDIPVVGDWDGNGTFTPGIVRGNIWYLRNSNSSGNNDIPSFGFGSGSPDIPIVGDWNGDGTWTCGVIRGNLWLLRNSNNTGAADFSFGYGSGGNTFMVWK